MNRDEEFGYIKGKIEQLEDKTGTQQTQLNSIETKLDDLSGQLSMYRHFVIWVRYVGVVGITLLTIKLGDIKMWWNGEGGE